MIKYAENKIEIQFPNDRKLIIPEYVDISDKNSLEELDVLMWDLICKYLYSFGIQTDSEKPNESIITKVQDGIINALKECGVRFVMEKSERKIAKYKSIDLFAGIGGIRRGFDNAFGAEIETVFVSEWDEYAKKTYKNNYSDDFEIAGDITQINEDNIPYFDICLAGFPCQAFSQAGKHMGFDDDYKGMCRGTLFLDVVRICDKHQPKVIFCENVKGLMLHDRGKTYKVIKRAFEQIGYKVFEKVLNSKDFGVPQNRERLYIVCFRNDIAPDDFAFPKGESGKVCIKDILDTAPVPSKYYLSDVYLDTLRKHKARHEAKGHGFGYEVRELDGIAGAIVCGGMGRERNLIIDHREHSMVPTTHITGKINGEDIRKMTPREWARLQGYPEDFKLELADTHLYKQLGNSVTVSVIEAIAKEIRNVLGKNDNIERTIEENTMKTLCMHSAA